MSSLTKLKRVATLTAGGTPSVDDARFWDVGDEGGTPWVSISDMSDGQVVTSTTRRVTSDGIVEKRLPVGDVGTLLFAMYASVGAVSTLGVRPTWNQALLGIQPRRNLCDLRFLRYWLDHLRPSLGALTRSNTQDNLNADQVGNFPFPETGLRVQRAIADYLDIETARIDALITRKRRMIELLDERWQAQVGAALTSVDRPLRLKQLLRSKPSYGVLVPRFVEPGHGVSFIRAGDLVALSNSDRSDLVEIDMAQSAEFRRTMTSAGDLLVSVVGTMGRAVVVTESFAGANIARAVCRLRPKHPTDGELLWLWVTATQAFLNQARLVTDGDTAQPTLNVGDLCEFQIGVSHDPDERAGLARKLISRSQQVVATRSKLSRQIELLTERRQALITAAVTGGLDIPGVAA